MAFMISSIIPSQYPIKPSIFELDKSEIYSEEKVVHEDVYTNISLHQPGQQYREQKDELLTLSEVKSHIGYIEF